MDRQTVIINLMNRRNFLVMVAMRIRLIAQEILLMWSVFFPRMHWMQVYQLLQIEKAIFRIFLLT